MFVDGSVIEMFQSDLRTSAKIRESGEFFG